MQNSSDRINGQSRLSVAGRWHWAVFVTLVLSVVVLDFARPFNLSLSIFYFLPVLYAAWTFRGVARQLIFVILIAIVFLLPIVVRTEEAIRPSRILNRVYGVLVGLFVIRLIIVRQRYETELLAINADLEDRVAERTADLQGTNLCLREEIAERAAIECELKQTTERLQILSRRIIEIQEAERRHLAIELHDEIGQVIAAVQIHLQNARHARPPAEAQPLEECIRIVHDAIQQVRSLSLDLRPPMLDDFGLFSALRWFVDCQRQLCGCSFKFLAHCEEARLLAIVENSAYRVAQEAITNVVRHASAASASIEVDRDDDELFLVVRDDGVGFDVPAARQQAAKGCSLGLLGMQERVELLGGKFELESAPGRGTTVRARFRLDPPHAMDA